MKSGLAVALLGGALVVRGAAPAPAPAKPAATNAPPVVVEIPKSLFVDDFKIGKDPFNPASTRRNPAPPKPPPVVPGTPGSPADPPKPPPPPPPPPRPSEFISLKGVLGGARPLAMINTTVKSYDIEAGEQISVKVPEATKLPDARVKVKCVEIKTDSIVIEIEGEPGRHELRLPRRI
ncbi:MAG: hypothetical protein HZA89_09795 [Verrucomicrobia bacterium]|nr:hypothetical protein [Verrucomicrobiota bacterium]